SGHRDPALYFHPMLSQDSQQVPVTSQTMRGAGKHEQRGLVFLRHHQHCEKGPRGAATPFPELAERLRHWCQWEF
ncbi:mCG1049097, partial [Mus musculus]